MHPTHGLSTALKRGESDSDQSVCVISNALRMDKVTEGGRGRGRRRERRGGKERQSGDWRAEGATGKELGLLVLLMF